MRSPLQPDRASASIPVSSRLTGFTYAIRNIVAEAQKVEATGRKVLYLNIGDPIRFGFATPPHLVETVERAIRDGQNGYGPSPGIASARGAVATEYTQRGWAVSPDRVVLTSGASEAIELVLTALVNPGEEVLVPAPTYPLYTAVLAKIGGRAVFYPLDSSRGWQPDMDQLAARATPRTRALVVIHPNNPTGAVHSEQILRALLSFSERRGFPLLVDEVYADLAFNGPVSLLGSLDPEAAVISFGSLSKGYLAPGWRAGWLAVGATPRLNSALAAVLKLADARLCSPLPMQHAIAAALTGSRSHQSAFVAALTERAELITRGLEAVEGLRCTPPAAAFYVMPQVALPPGKTDEDYVLGLLRETGLLCVHGSGFNLDPRSGYFRIVFLSNPAELRAGCDAIAEFTRNFLRREGRS
ncbi:MAG TPA: aminotransferase class I/II-fold pyridoxal phosphate-dependent enzyme [Myxococcaceae bacterium]|nr:aminotransferase class I/II-fold pyridoxal phosphate-dependent enzyme [Myxococcaceae bacterium]